MIKTILIGAAVIAVGTIAATLILRRLDGPPLAGALGGVERGNL